MIDDAPESATPATATAPTPPAETPTPASSTPPAPRATPMNLAALLSALVIFDLAIGRIFVKLLPEDGAGVPEWLNESARFAARFLGLFTAIFAWLLVVLMLGTLARRAYYRRSTRVSMLFIGSVFAALVGLGLFGKIPGLLLIHLYLSFFFLGSSIVLAMIASDAPGRHRLAMLLLLIPVAARYLVTMNDRFATFLGWPRQGEWLGHVDAVVLVAGVIAALLLTPTDRSQRKSIVGPLLVAALFTGGAATLVHQHWDIAQRIAQSGFGLELPLLPWVAIAYCVGFGALVYGITSGLAGAPRDQLRAYGLCILVANGLQLYWPSQLAVAMVGLFCMLEALARPRAPAWTRRQQEEELRLAAVAAGATQVSFSGPPGDEAARVVGVKDDQPVEVIVEWRGGHIASVEINVGSAPPRDPPFTIERRGTSDGPTADGPRVSIDDVFDRDLVVHDRKSVGAHILDPETMARTLLWCEGWLAVWPQRGVRYRATRMSSAPQRLQSTIIMLTGIWQKAA